MRLLVTRTAQGVWAWLDPDTVEEISALEQCAAQGEWTNGAGTESIPRLQALATRLGHPVGAPERHRSVPSTSRMIVVRQREHALYQRLVAMRWASVRVIMDRRRGERRTTDRPSAGDRRRRSRRAAPPPSWTRYGSSSSRRRSAMTPSIRGPRVNGVRDEREGVGVGRWPFEWRRLGSVSPPYQAGRASRPRSRLAPPAWRGNRSAHRADRAPEEPAVSGGCC